MHLMKGASRVVPRGAVDGVLGFIAGRIVSNPDSPLMRAVRTNQWVVSGETLAGEALDAAVRSNVESIARFLYDYYHVLGNERAERELLLRDKVFDAVVEREASGGGPFVYVGAHYGNFDFVGRQLGRAGWHMQILSVADPNAGYAWQNQVREEVGFEVTPVSVDALKKAARRLEAGQSVLTGLDRPLDAPDKVMPELFGRPAPLPLLHVRLAMRAGVPVVVLVGPRDPDGRYRLLASDPIPMTGTRPTPEALLDNARRCLEPVERWISADPAQWAMPHVVWPDAEAPR
jgi:KDO2-lipid IV(A) lauroyltransferase